MKPIFVVLLIYMLMLSCSPETKTEEHTGHDHGKNTPTQYTCPMHPNIVKDEPGKCPVCGMDLVPVTQTASTDLMLTDSQIRLANITTQKISLQPIGQTVAVTGRLTENEDLSEVISSRVAGRIEKLYRKETGRSVQKGEPLYQLYSETLLTLQREYLLAKEQYETLGSAEKRYKSFLDAATKKLLLYGLTENQIAKLGQSKNVQNTILFLSPASGIVSEIPVTEGQYVSEGSTLMRIENTSTLWLEAELYPSETELVNVGDKINVRVSGYENEKMEAIVTFFSPEFRGSSQIVLMRASIPNGDLKYKPGMQAHVFFTHSSKKALTLPTDAVIRDGRGGHVYVQRGRNNFRPLMVKTGVEDFEKVEITGGLAEGDTVAVTGAYLLYSEIILKKGADPMASHSH